MNTTDSKPFAPGSKVVIRHNPHHGVEAEDIVATVTQFAPGSGFMGCDMAWVRYQLPGDGNEHEMPFGTANLDRGDPQALLARAVRHEEQAAKLRAMAAEVAP